MSGSLLMRVIMKTSESNIFEQDLSRRSANFQPLTPLDFLKRAADVYPEKVAVIYGNQKHTYRQLCERCCCMAGALANRGIGAGDTVAIISPNTPALLEAHFHVPMAGAVLNAINTRLEATTIARILEHGRSRILFSDKSYSAVVESALSMIENPPLVVDIDDPLAEEGRLIGDIDYEAFLHEGKADHDWQVPEDEWQALSLNYTSGTTGNPKGVVYHHRGAFLNALGNAMMFGLNERSVYLWTLPMFHCNGWSFPWSVTAVGGTHVCLRHVAPGDIFSSIESCRVTHLCGAPVVLNMLIHAPDELKSKFDWTIEIGTGGAAPPSSVIAEMENMGFRVTHLYGLTESYGPSTICAWQQDWEDLPQAEKARKIARQGVRNITLSSQMVADPVSMQPVPFDGETIGEVMLRGNTLMKGYLLYPEASEAAFAGGWFHTGDLAVVHPDGYMEIKDRSKDIIISGGENISSIEIEEILYRHPDIMEAAVVARPDDNWGESPCAFITLRPETALLTEDEIIFWCRDKLAHFKCPRTVVFGELPKTSTGKIQKFKLREQARNL